MKKEFTQIKEIDQVGKTSGEGRADRWGVCEKSSQFKEDANNIFNIKN